MDPTQHAMDQAQGAAIRVQLEALVASLRPHVVLADRFGDQAVVELLASLQAAHAAAHRIERRAPAGATLHTTGKGVQLAKVTSLSQRNR